ncbi:thiamine pyrophosphate-binding protein [Chelativorans xinjiangense]|uniref:thiamine pyrophosphate-binding protein n=1 Tax=Chelativorans xinjiangense TaxID=2681485 RepID=UPI001356966A|nr:thiamine pyrophosphate-binding protein [Chelativorans xinjiangense]
MLDNSQQPRVYDMLARAFINERIDVCFGLLGDANMKWAARLAEAGCRMVYVRHEHCAVAASMAYARKSGRVGVATVTCGPGLTQTMTALPAAVYARLPLVVFVGEAPLRSGWYNQGIDQAPFVKAAGAAYRPLHTIERMAMEARDAFLQAQEERRPVVLGVPMDLQEDRWTGDDLPAPSYKVRTPPKPVPPHPDDLAVAASMIGEARRVIVLAGLGAAAPAAAQSARALAVRVDGILATTLPARGLFHEDPFSAGIAGGLAAPAAKQVYAEADLIVAVGTSLAFHTSMAGRLWPKAKVLQINTEARTVSEGRVCADYFMRADATMTLDALNAALPERLAEWRSDALAKRFRAAPFSDYEPQPSPDGAHDPRSAVEALQAALPRHWQLVNTSGHVSYFTTQMPGRPQDAFLTIREFGAIGNGTSFAMGVAAARPDTPVVLLDGDGSFLMHSQELDTIRRSRMKILVVVLNDGAYGSEIHKLRAHGLTEEGAVFGRPDLAQIARGFGLEGHTLTDLGDLPKIIDAFAKGDRAMVVNIPISDQVLSPAMQRRIEEVRTKLSAN